MFLSKSPAGKNQNRRLKLALEDQAQESTSRVTRETLANKYQIKEKIGQGHLGEVFQAESLDSGQEFAIKFLSKTYSNQDRAIQRFAREARAASELNHPNIVKVYEFGDTDDGSCYIVMELIKGITLRRIIRRNGPLAAAECVKIFLEISDALAHAHDRGLVHRDLKPSNIIIVKRGEENQTVKLVDFGLARHLDSEKQAEEKVTLEGYVVGTPAYMSPEQCLGKSIDLRSDIYSLGCVMFRALTGMAPVAGNTARETMENQIHRTTVPLDRIPRHIAVPDELKEIMRKSLMKEPEDRYQSVKEFIEDLQKFEI